MKKQKWYLKEGDKMTEMTAAQLMAYTTFSKAIKISTYEDKKLVTKIVEFTK